MDIIKGLHCDLLADFSGERTRVLWAVLIMYDFCVMTAYLFNLNMLIRDSA